MHRTTAALAVTGLLLVTGCSGGNEEKADASTPPGATVHLAFTLLKPTDVTIQAGQALTFVDDNPIGHVMVQGAWKADPRTGLRTEEHDDGVFSLRLDRPGQLASHTFAEAGTYPFFCTIHKGMNGRVTVI